MEKILGNN